MTTTAIPAADTALSASNLYRLEALAIRIRVILQQADEDFLELANTRTFKAAFGTKIRETESISAFLFAAMDAAEEIEGIVRPHTADDDAEEGATDAQAAA